MSEPPGAARKGRGGVSAASNGSDEPTSEAPALLLTDISRRFGSVVALEKASLRVNRGTVHALLGENGAGKTTLMRVAFGLIRADGGSTQVRGRTVQFSTPRDALQNRIGMVHQHFTLVPAMTVAENVALGGTGLFSLEYWAKTVRKIGAETGLVLDPMARVRDLSVSAQQRCEIVKALARNVDLLILDEPTAVLAPDEARELLRWMQSFARNGNAIVLITHKLRDALSVAQDITVLRHGKSVFTGASSTTSEDELAAAMLGIDSGGPVSVPDRPQVEAVQQPTQTLNAVIRVRDATVRDARGIVRLNRVSLDVNAGEIVGVAGVEGAGQHEVLRVLAGRVRPASGEVTVPERVGFVPEDRHHDALMLDASLVENIALRDAGLRRGRMPWLLLHRATRDIVAERDVKAAGVDVSARTLSGGNQQKLVIGRELAEAPKALIVENPTRGLDFRATRAVHNALREARERGTAVVVYSSDLDEVLLLADRVAVMHGGTLTEVPKDRAAIGRAMLGS